MATRTRIWGMVLLLLAVGTIGLLTLRPAGPSSEPQVCCYPADFTLNVLLFAPLGVALALVGLRLPYAAATGLMVSAAIETAQAWIPGRFSSLTDVITNSLGTLLGAVLVLAWPARRKWWTVVGPGLAVTIGASWVLAALVVRPSKVRIESSWWAEWRPPNSGIPRFPGQVLDLSLQGYELPNGAIAEWKPLARAVDLADTVRFEASIVSGPPLEQRTQIAGVYMGAPWYQYLSLWQEGQDLLVYQRLGMNEAGFRPPALRVRSALPAVSGMPVHIALRTTRNAVMVALNGENLSTARLSLSPEEAWTAFLPFGYSQSGKLAVWPVLLALGTFFVAGAGFRHGVIVPALFGMAVLVPPSLITGASLPSWPIYAAAALGLWSGRQIARRLGLL